MVQGCAVTDGEGETVDDEDVLAKTLLVALMDTDWLMLAVEVPEADGEALELLLAVELAVELPEADGEALKLAGALAETLVLGKGEGAVLPLADADGEGVQ